MLLAVGDEVAPPVLPVGAELPAWATGADSASDEAAPVLPVLVLPDCEVAAPVLPDVAVGLMVTVEAPPAPPLAAPVEAPLPPTWAPAGPAAAAKARAAAAKAAATPQARFLAEDVVRLSTFTSFTATGEVRRA